ncbi:uncharacterized membrane protein HdeD (DUF308 family) [Streptomyces aurantiacus]|uniref:hypothetical protein n=1 Tax=Streptomyces aurantiacus TaxID=47760 RepID=UPI002793ED5D|nr:hypothetical protein [Streptomyces aurantiacus]MDQ0775668.1 uncharacterized membrane protein HdeD (DUF308 family) [Streptomyces aurantiacus]
MARAATTDQETAAPALRRLYLIRFLFALVWAAVLLSLGSDLTLGVTALLVLYPAFDVAAAVFDARSARATRPAKGLYANMAVSTAAAIGLAAAGASGTADVLRVWGAWAIVSGLVQLVVALLRRAMGGQWAMILSGGISVLAGASFVADAATADPSVTHLARYATLGGIFFLISAIRLIRTTTNPAVALQ